jgi:hypothetical protein
MPCTNRKWKLDWVAQFTVVCKMQTAQLLMALTSPITQQTDSFIYGSRFQNAWHLAAETQNNYEPRK